MADKKNETVRLTHTASGVTVSVAKDKAEARVASGLFSKPSSKK